MTTDLHNVLKGPGQLLLFFNLEFRRCKQAHLIRFDQSVSPIAFLISILLVCHYCIVESQLHSLIGDLSIEFPLKRFLPSVMFCNIANRHPSLIIPLHRDEKFRGLRNRKESADSGNNSQGAPKELEPEPILGDLPEVEAALNVHEGVEHLEDRG